MRTFLLGLLCTGASFVGFAATANASASIDLIWGGGSSNTTLLTSSSATLNIIYTNDVQNVGASVSVDYGLATGKFSIVNFFNNPNAGLGLLPLELGPTIDTGSAISSFNAAALPPYVGTGLAGGQSYLLGTITFHKDGPGKGLFVLSSFLGINDSIDSGAGGSVPVSQVNLGTASLGQMPEPGTAALLALGLAGLAFTGRTNTRRSIGTDSTATR